MRLAINQTSQPNNRECDEHAEKNQPRRNQRIIDRRRNIVKFFGGENRHRHYIQLSSSNPQPALALFEERPKRRQIILPGVQRDRVDIIPPQGTRKLCSLLSDQIRETRPRRAIGRVDLDLFACLGVLQSNDADIRQRFFPFVLNVDGDEIVSPAAYRERSRKIRRLKIRDEEDHCAPGDDLVQIIRAPVPDLSRDPAVRKTESRESAAAYVSGPFSAE